MMLSWPWAGRTRIEICQMGRKVLGIKRSVCLVHNPRNAALFEELGVDRAVNLPMILAQAILGQKQEEGE